MKKVFLPLILLLATIASHAQQLYLEGFPSWNRTAYNAGIYPDKKNYLAVGARLAAGSDHFQIGGEYRTDLTTPEFAVGSTTQTFKEKYYGGFLRYKIARYPAMRFGLVLKAGAGVHQTTLEYSNPGKVEYDYDPIIGANAGAGISIPLGRPFMLELGYAYHYQKRPELQASSRIISGHDASYHLFSAGLSMNFVFGKRKDAYDRINERRRFKDGWRG